MSKITEYLIELKTKKDWIPYLLENSGLPGPRGNLELAHAAARSGDRRRFETLLGYAPEAAENTPQVFLIFCGVMGLGSLAARGDREMFARLRPYASDSRWRVREGVATGLQLAGDADMSGLVREMKKWSAGNWLEKRAAAAALAEPRLLKEPRHAKQVLQILDRITASMETAEENGNPTFKVLSQGMSYCWSVAVAALPKEGKPFMEKWLKSGNPAVRRIMKENLKKNRLLRMDEKWVKACLSRL